MALHKYLVFFCLLAVVYPKSLKDDSVQEDIEEYIANKQLDINPRYRLHYHVIPPVGWMNDPNGFSYYKGEYHIFYQYYPYDSVWGPMHWGHSSSPNLVDWKTLPTALVPEEEMCFSGGAVADGDTMILMYTGRVVTDEEPYFNETQYLAFSNDGIQFTKYDGNPVLKETPNNSPDFRDPKVWKHGEHWYAIIGSKTDDETGRVLLYRSLDMINWEFLRILGESTGEMGYMWECPDLFELNGKFVFLWSPQGLAPQGDRFKNIYQTGYIIGNFNYETFEFIPETEFEELDYGHDFYASQTAEKDGKRYQVAWFNTWEKTHPEAADGWAGALTMFRELELVGDRILMKPVEDMITLRGELVLDGELQKDDTIDFDQTGEIIIKADLEKKIEILIAGRNGGDKVWIRWDPEVGKVSVDRSGDVRQVKWSPISSHSWRLFLDASSLELFCGEGEVVFSSRAYPDGEWSLTNLSPQVVNIEAYKLRRSVPYP
ncbi:Beta-fructofuranosidase 2 [Operophtera brumata]|uniref:Sucrose-6-phosphate hydrolase n=1 Tax=Operophtera brumata TaxID=104452 RepID=A0A0L7LA48_OPEBR|nr:Beta-fructofuranosidase 2 [Operophtera brumata]